MVNKDDTPKSLLGPMSASFHAKMQIKLIRQMKSSAILRLIFKDDLDKLASLDAADKALDMVIEDWQRMIERGDEAEIRARLDRLYVAQARQEEDEILARAEQIKRERGAPHG